MGLTKTLLGLPASLAISVKRKKIFRAFKQAYTSAMVSFIVLATFLWRSVVKKDRLQRMLMRAVEKVSQMTVPKMLRKKFFSAYSKHYQVHVEDMIEPFESYRTFSAFFTRRVKPRSILQQDNILSVPADSKILRIAEITQDSCSIIKGASYSLGELLSGQLSYSQEQINALKLGRNNKLYQVVLYLAPGDYHRFHSPTELSVVSKTPIGGRHMSVNEKTLARKKKVYEKNARLCLTGTWSEGFLAMVMVGALNVSKIVMSEQLRFRKGDEIGYFNLGSTIVLLFEAKNVLEWKVSQGQKVRYGDSLCVVEQSEPTMITNDTQ